MESAMRLDHPVEESFIYSPGNREHQISGVSWSAVVGGAFVAAAIALIMLALGTGFGLSVVSPWSNVGAAASGIGTAAIIWLIVTQVVPYALGGYLAGRLRSKWVAVHTDEVYFRDTANGFLVWAVGVVMTAVLLASAAGSMLGNSIREDTPETGASIDLRVYFVDRLFRSGAASTQPDVAVQAEVGRILANVLRRKDSGGSEDEAYLANMVVAKTGLRQSDAAARVSQVTLEARRAEDDARQTASRVLLWSFLALLMGAFSASYAATIGGRQRDHVKAL